MLEGMAIIGGIFFVLCIIFLPPIILIYNYINNEYVDYLHRQHKKNKPAMSISEIARVWIGFIIIGLVFVLAIGIGIYSMFI